ncbi:MULTISPECIES: SulP family inorganic anion transporter [Providencia]|uniref:SulP family inorganic anion transporter n=1 Tax=Providencia huaxiensis TaxID=2027290 RepID=A0ABU2IYP5_9GAMM|nr:MULTISPECIES: SulP family inorganic anion transporter [Providencia]MBZ3680644.1 SulP family inorganic anion transporter [Providencia rettgeri]AXH61401.1 SulP family inorganic anion transporter [Providencia huaxiensis]MDT0133670.1 SulP family inorganic anion transporter [Providencia huaxiensis]MDT1980076.1 SulP family inorganic anion transporter [Providencia huaxiensis]QLQ99509.1 SulP family inorganic anion transporter [Providencia rettgeri]
MIKARLFVWMPGLKTLFNYQRADLGPDVKAGLSVAAVALPVAIAYAELMGVNAIVGLYSCILPMLFYALFGTSKQLIIGPDAATCAVIAAAVAPLAMGDETVRWQLIIVMSFMTGVWCLIAARFRLGTFADFLSRPILQGLLNGVALTIIVSQISKVFGITTLPSGFIERLIAFPLALVETHIPTLLVAIVTLVITLVIKRVRSKWPSLLIAMVLATAASILFNLEQYGISTVGDLGEGLPHIPLPDFPPSLLRDLVIPSLNLAVISFVSFMMTARSFASKNGYTVDADQELRALGMANIASAFGQGFAVSAASSRTAVNDMMGGKTQLVSLVAAVTILAVLLFSINLLEYIPMPALGMVLIISTYSLLSFRSIFSMRKRNREAFFLCVFTLCAVLVVGLISGVGLAVLLGLLQFVRVIFRPTDQLLGVDEHGMLHSMTSENDIQEVDGVLIYRFNSPLTYFNVNYFKERLNKHLDNQRKRPAWVIVDAAVSFTHNDVSVFSTLNDIVTSLKAKGVTLVLAGRRTSLNRWLEQNKINRSDDDLLVVPDIYFAIRLIQSKQQIQMKCVEERKAQESQRDSGILEHDCEDRITPTDTYSDNS